MDQTIKWEMLKGPATAGLNRLPFQAPESSLLDGLPLSDHPGEQLLLALGSFWQVRKAGFQPDSFSGSWPQSPAAQFPYMPQAATDKLHALLKGNDQWAMLELLQLCLQHQRRIPAAMVPDLLDWGLRSELSSEILLQACGSRGTWLAAQNPAWKLYLPLPEETWEMGSPSERSLYFSRLRQIDSAKARRLFAEMIKKEGVKQLNRFLALFTVGLSEEDIPILEMLRQHQHREIRATSTHLLTQMGQSTDLQKDLFAILSKILRDSPESFPVLLPDDILAQSQKPVLASIPIPSLQTGPKTQQLMRLLVATRLEWWENQFQASVPDILERQVPEDARSWLPATLVLASVHQQNAPWAEALWTHCSKSKSSDFSSLLGVPQSALASFARLLSEETYQQQLAAIIANVKTTESLEKLLRLLAQFQRPLREQTAFLFARRLLQIVERIGGSPPVALRSQLESLFSLMMLFPPSLHARLTHLWADNPTWPQWYDEALQKALYRLQFRLELQQAFG